MTHRFNYFLRTASGSPPLYLSIPSTPTDGSWAGTPARLCLGADANGKPSATSRACLAAEGTWLADDTNAVIKARVRASQKFHAARPLTLGTGRDRGAGQATQAMPSAPCGVPAAWTITPSAGACGFSVTVSLQAGSPQAEGGAAHVVTARLSGGCEVHIPHATCVCSTRIP